MKRIVSVEVPDPPMSGGKRKPYSVSEHIDLITAAFSEARDMECDRVIDEAQARLDARKDVLRDTPEIEDHNERMTREGES